MKPHIIIIYFPFSFVQVVTEPCGSVVLLWRHGGHVTDTRDFQLQTTQMLEASCLFSFKSILLRTSGKYQSIERTAWMLNFIYIVQSKWYLNVQGPFKGISQVAEKCVALVRIGHSATTWCSFLSWRKRKQRKYQRIMGNSSHVTRCFDFNLTHHYTSEINQVCWVLSAPLSGC